MTGYLAWVGTASLVLATSTAMTIGAQQPAAAQTARTLPSVTGSGAPRTFQVVSIPVPEELSNAAQIQADILSRGDFAVLGAKTQLLVSPTARKNRVTVTIGIPAGALAGNLVAAEARFSSSESPILIVPVAIDVSLVRQLSVSPSSDRLHGQAGSDFLLPFQIVNSGNAVERVNAEFSLPDGWTVRGTRQTSLVIEPGATLKRKLRIAIPALSSTGSSFVNIDLRANGETLATSSITVEVSNAGSIGSYAGPQIVSAVSHAADENGNASRVYVLTANGALFDSVRLDARVSHASSLGAATGNAFARMGMFSSSPYVAFSAPSGDLSLGTTGTSLSDLTGLYPYGQGALLRMRRPGWDLTGFGALSMRQGAIGKRHPMLGLRGERQLGEIRISSSLSRLADAGPSPRRLEAVGLGAAVPALFGSTLKAEVAERRFDGGRGFGWSSELIRTASGSSEQLRVTHAPGGSDAFARATNEIVANVSERLTSRVMVSGSGWRSTDATSVFSGLKSSGLSLRPQYDLRESATLAIEARTYAFDASSRPSATDAGSAFGTRENQLGVMLSTHVREFFLNTSAFMGNITRTVASPGQSGMENKSPRNYWATSAGWAGISGTVEVQTRIEQTRDRGGLVNQQNIYGIRGDQLVLPWLGGVRAQGELQRVHGFGSEKNSTMRFGLAVPLVNRFAVRIDAERNSIFRNLSGRTPWIIGATIEHALTLPMIRRPGATGYVYQDLNGNQRRDSGEPGVPEALVRRGSESSVTDASGRYRIGGDGGQPIVVDEASLIEGWTANAVSGGDLGVSLSTSAVVELVVAPRAGFSLEIDLGKAIVIARDAAGREWFARMTGPSTATFDALPVGTYTLEFDLSQLSEPLVARGPVPTLIVNGQESKSLSITLDPRPIRMWNPTSQRQRDGNGAPQGIISPADPQPKSTVTPADK